VTRRASGDGEVLSTICGDGRITSTSLSLKNRLPTFCFGPNGGVVINIPMRQTGKHYWISDLHLFARRSIATQYLAEFRATAARADIFVLGGDIFDFVWTTRGTIAETVDQAVQWLESLIEHAPHCQFHFLLGNHDCYGPFVTRLAKLQDSAANFCWHPFVLRLGDSVFLHGDVADRSMDAEQLAHRRARHDQLEKKAPWLHTLYDLVVAVRLHTFAAMLVYPKTLVARRILRYLDQIGHGWATGLQHVYFGHTHVSMSDFEYSGVRFHNGGAPLIGVPFQILETVIKQP
jgi:UDP-2,3-diacylglucosamine hydrolase